jgi:hypothetical protein
MYIFTSAIFFIIFFWLFKIEKFDINKSVITGKDSINWLNAQQLALKNADNHGDSVEIQRAIDKVKSGFSIAQVTRKPGIMTVRYDSMSYKSVGQYDSIQASLPEDKRDGWLTRTVKKRELHIAQDYNGDQNEFWRNVINDFLHQFPKMFFISLPLFALVLNLLYVRRKQFYYTEHTIFTIHLYVFTFIYLLVFFSLQKINSLHPTIVWQILQFILWLYWLYYTYRAMRVFYQQPRGKTIVKYILLNLSAMVGLLILFTIFFTYSLFEL